MIDFNFGISTPINQPGKYAVSGKFITGLNSSVWITRVIYRNPATIVFWSDNTKTITKVNGTDKYSKEAGFTMCVLKKLIGATTVKNLLDDWCTASDTITVKEIRDFKKSQKKADRVSNSAETSATDMTMG